MVYNQRWVPNIPVPPPAAPNPGNNPGNDEVVKGAPVMSKGSGNFDIGQETEGGGHSFDGKHIVNVDDMTKEQLGQAAKETNYELKRLAIKKRQHETMVKKSLGAATPNEFEDDCYEEPFLTMEEVPPFDGLGNPKYNTIESIRLETAKWLAEILAEIADMEAVKKRIGELGGPVPLAPTPESPVPSEIDKVKKKVGEIEQHLVPTPGTPPAEEPLPGEWPMPIPEKPTLEDKVYDGLDPITLLSMHRVYLLNLAKYEEAKQFNMCWGIEIARDLLNQLRIAKTPGTQEEVFQHRLTALGDITFELETKGVFHD